jgi:hypothetical protein
MKAKGSPLLGQNKLFSSASHRGVMHGVIARCREEGPMTRKRDLKKRIRDRQAKTGETYTTARRHVLAARPATDDEQLEPTDPGIAEGEIERQPPSGERFADELHAASRGETDVPVDELRKLVDLREPIQVDEVIDVSDAAGELGIACKVLVYERLANVADPKLALVALRDALGAMAKDSATLLLRAVVAGQKTNVAVRPRMPRDEEFMSKIRAGLTAVSNDGRMIVLHVNGYQGMVTVVCAAWRQSQTLIMTTPEDRIGPVVAGLGAFGSETLFLVYEGRRYPIPREPFVIGRHTTCNLQIRDGHISRKHAAIVQRHGVYYILDLGSHAGIDYRGIRISNKKIEEGDMFMLHEYALRFTFLETDA